MAARTNFVRSEMFTTALDHTAEELPHKIILTYLEQPASHCWHQLEFDIFFGIPRFKTAVSCTRVLITSYHVPLYGQTFEHVCNYAILLEYTQMFIDIIDARNALRPVGSITNAYCLTHIPDILDTFHRFQLSKRQAETFASEAKFAPELDGQLRLIAGYEAIRAYMGYQYSDYPRSRVHWSDIDNPEIEREFELYSALR
ncbi:hypothetical protein CEP54_002552 [Fusarium duplospermum]|uniref:Uncharacterized protein n=1 Tax=Fusarium duplospermum TaxID=1325734 RepID=A0A428QUK1_9HYPO|nr:hypothetical protein CEP54_002552 [Fusarium duplospermum]